MDNVALPSRTQPLEQVSMKSQRPAKRRTGKRTERTSGGSHTVLNRDIQSKIGDQLRALHDNIVKEGVPDRFLDLLSQLDKSASGNDRGR
jgi:hypothetical protein